MKKISIIFTIVISLILAVLSSIFKNIIKSVKQFYENNNYKIRKIKRYFHEIDRKIQSKIFGISIYY